MTAASDARQSRPWPALAALSLRELRRFLRQPSRALGSLGAAALFWVFLGSGFSTLVLDPRNANSAAADPDQHAIPFAGYLTPGVALMVVMFAVVVWSIGLIQDRASGFLQSALVSPAPMTAVIGSKLLAGGAIAGLQGALVLAAAPLAGLHVTPLGVLAAAAVLVLASIGVMALSLALAWRIDSVSGYHSVMNVLLLPLWALSGAVFPLDGAAGWLRNVMLLNPLTWANEAAGALINARPHAHWWHVPGLAAFTVLCVALAMLSMRRAAAAASRPAE